MQHSDGFCRVKQRQNESEMCIRDRSGAPRRGGRPPQDPAAVHRKGAAGHRTGARGAGALFCPSAAKHRCRHPGGVFRTMEVIGKNLDEILKENG